MLRSGLSQCWGWPDGSGLPVTGRYKPWLTVRDSRVGCTLHAQVSRLQMTLHDWTWQSIVYSGIHEYIYSGIFWMLPQPSLGSWEPTLKA